MDKKKNNITTIYLFKSLVILVFALGLTGCESTSHNSITRNGFYFDTLISVTLYDKNKASALDHCMELAKTYESYFSDTLANSDVSKINAHPGTPVEVHPQTAELIALGIHYYEVSSGRFDISIGRLSDLWDIKKAKVPTEKRVLTALSHVDAKAIKIHDNTVTLLDEKAAIDLGGIAKGYIADKMKEYLLSEGIHAGLINLGGNVLTLDKKPDHSLYTIGIQKPFSEDGTPILSVDVADTSVVTSGTYQRYFEKDGHIYHHIIDTQTGYPCDNELTSVTICGSSSAEGDALSTSVFLMGLDEGMKFIESQNDLEAVFITTDQKLHYSSHFKEKYPCHEYP